MSANPGYRNQASARNVFRTLGIVLAVGGLAFVAWGFAGFVSGMDAELIGEDSTETLSLIKFVGGAFATVVGLAFLNAGFGGAAARYAAGETMPVARDSLEFLTDGKGPGHLGRASGEPVAAVVEKSGPFCSRCGVRNDATATFCDACGDRLV